MANEGERMRILEMIERGEINASEGLRLLQDLAEQEIDGLDQSASATGPPQENEPEAAGQILNAGDEPVEATGSVRDLYGTATPTQSGEEDPAGPEVFQARSSPLPPNTEKLRLYWMIPLWFGVGITVLGSLLLYWALQATGISFWFFLASAPFLLGVLVMALSWQSRWAHWLHLRIEQPPGATPQHISLSFPLPIRLTAWMLRNYGHWVPALEGTALDEVILALGGSTTPENPVYIEVDEGENGERVVIFIT